MPVDSKSRNYLRGKSESAVMVSKTQDSIPKRIEESKNIAQLLAQEQARQFP